MAPEAMDELMEVSRSTFLGCASSGYNVFKTLDAVTQSVLAGFHSGLAESESRARMAAPKITPARDSVSAVEAAKRDQTEPALAS